MEKDINTEVSNTQLPATEEKANLKESLRIQKSQWISTGTFFVPGIRLPT